MSDLETVLSDVSTHLADATPASAHRAIQDALVALRDLLRMEVAFVSRVSEGRRWVDFLDQGDFAPYRVGDSDPLRTTYCARVIDGRISGLVPDTSKVPEVADLPLTRSMPIGAHLAVPIEGLDGTTMGTLCCFSRQPEPELSERDLELLTVFGRMIERHLQFLSAFDRRAAYVTNRVEAVLRSGGPRIALQPIIDLETGLPAGYEALSRFEGALDPWSPDRWFREADDIGLGHELEAAAIRAALTKLSLLPDHVTLSVNVSARALCTSKDIAELLTGEDASRLVVELTEHARVDDYGDLCGNLMRVRDSGVRIAVDDAGSGYAGLEHILRLAPEVLKLDRSLVQDVAQHPGRQAMCTAMVGFTQRMDATLVAEGVEVDADLDMLGDLGVPMAQGFLLGHPRVPEGRLMSAGMGGCTRSL